MSSLPPHLAPSDSSSHGYLAPKIAVSNESELADFDALLKARLSILHASQDTSFPYQTEVAGSSFTIYPGVFSPRYFESSEVFISMLDFYEEEDFLDLGTGCGVAAIFAARAGARRVLATDISAAAVANARRNIGIHGFQEVAIAQQSDVFDNIAADEKFSTVFWNTPWVWAPASYKLNGVVESAVCDPGYGSLRKFLRQARRHIAPNGRILVGTGSFARMDLFEDMVREYGYTSDRIRDRRSLMHPEFEFFLYSLRSQSR